MSPRTSERTCCEPARGLRAAARGSSIDTDRSMPTRWTPLFAMGTRIRPVPQPNSSTGPPAAAASRSQNATSRRWTVGRSPSRRTSRNRPSLPSPHGHEWPSAALPNGQIRNSHGSGYILHTRVCQNRNSLRLRRVHFPGCSRPIGRVRSMFISQAESTGFSEPDSERAPAELARRRRWPAMMSRNTLARAAAIGLIVIWPASARPRRLRQPRHPSPRPPSASGVRRGVRLERRQFRHSWRAAAVAQCLDGQDCRVRDRRSTRPVPFRRGSRILSHRARGRVHKAARRRPGLHDRQGETVATFVRLGTKLPWIAGFFSNAAAAAITAAAARA